MKLARIILSAVPTLFAVSFLILTLHARAFSGAANDTDAAQPVLVELFTSEGCSSCPPADALLANLQTKAGSGGPSVVVLSEHVDYWNHDGWRDPFSSAAFTQRQSAYSDRFHLGSVYTPQMVVDGQYQFVGSDRSAAARAVSNAAGKEKVHLAIESAEWSGDTLMAKVTVGPLPASLAAAKLYAVLADVRDTSQVEGGENGGRTLTHVSVVRVMQEAANLSAGGEGSVQTVRVHLPAHAQHGNLRLVVFAQQPDFGPVIGAATLLP